jgi:hypothetical protein
MRGFFFGLAIAFVVAVAVPASAQSSQPSGGLTVCCGGSFGYIGGSGSVSGSVIGPGGSGRSVARAPVARPAPAFVPTAVVGGVVRPTTLPVSTENVRTASSHRSAVPLVLVGLVLAGSMFVYRKLSLREFRRPGRAR